MASDVPFDKILNFRDVGKSTNALTNQTLLKEGVFFRSARPDSATASDRQRIQYSYKIKTIIDLRTPTEHLEQTRKHASSKVPPAPAISPPDPAEPLRIEGIEYKDVNFNGSSYSNALIKQLTYLNTAKLFGLYVLGYRKEAISVLGTNVMAKRGLSGLAEDSLLHCKAEVGEVFATLCEGKSYPVLVHCTQGKDRTGLVVLLVLLLCGVEIRAIGEDYVMSQRELESEREEKVAEIRSIGLPDSFADCPDDWVANVSDYLERHGGVEIYLEACGVTKHQQTILRKLLKAT